MSCLRSSYCDNNGCICNCCVHILDKMFLRRMANLYCKGDKELVHMLITTTNQLIQAKSVLTRWYLMRVYLPHPQYTHTYVSLVIRNQGLMNQKIHVLSHPHWIFTNAHYN